MDFITILIILIAILVLWNLSSRNSTVEGFIPMLQPGTTHNMSYDIRGDPYIPFHQVSPWYNPEVLPIRNPEMYIG